MEKDPPCPIILLERFGFEMKIEYKEMQLQLLLSPAILISTDKVSGRLHRDSHLNQGHMMLSGLQIRGHGMFSDRGRTLEQKTLEYAWMLEIQIGKLSAKLTSPQVPVNLFGPFFKIFQEFTRIFYFLALSYSNRPRNISAADVRQRK